MPDILSEAREHYASSVRAEAALPPFGQRWDGYRAEMRRAIEGFQSSEEAIEQGQLRFGFDHRGPVTDADIPMMDIAQFLLRNEYPHFRDEIPLFEDTRATSPGTAIEYHSRYGRRVFASQILYFHAFYVLTISTFKKNVASICEVGGGYGNPALLWLTNPVHRVARYTIVDLPESLFFAEMFLRTAVPEIAFHYGAATDGPGISLVPLHLASTTRQVQFDFVVNTGSLAEMTDEWVAYWGNWLDQQNADLFYSHNYFANPAGRLFEGNATLAPVVSEDWHPVYVRPMHPMMLLHSEERRAAEIIFRRGRIHRDASALLTFLGNARLSFETYIYLVYAILADRDADRRRAAAQTLSRKAVADFGYAPVEMQYLASSTAKQSFVERAIDGLRTLRARRSS